MSTPTREPCPKCDMPRASKEDWDKIPGEPNADLCWATGKADCRNPAVDWRARCLKAESALGEHRRALSIMDAPLSPEALQAIAEESEP